MCSVHPIRRCLSVLVLLFGAAALLAQPQVRFTEANALDLHHRIDRSAAARTAMDSSGIGKEHRATILCHAEVRFWPSAITTVAGLEREEPYLRNYVLFEEFRYVENGREKVVALMPVLENLHMPDGMRPLSDIHLVLFGDGVEPVVSGLRPPSPIRLPRWDTLTQVVIREPAGLFATYQLMQDFEARRVLEAAGLDRRAIELMAYRCHENQWPPAIAGFDKRYPKIKRFRKFNVAEVARWDDKVLLLAPASRNRHLPKGMRPIFDLYLVYSASGVQDR